MGSAAARLLFLCGFPVAVLERAQPLAVRRLVCFAEAVLSGSADVEGVVARLVAPDRLEMAVAEAAFVPVAADPDGMAIGLLRPAAVVDARMAKRNLGTRREDAPLVIGLGPGLVAGEDVHAVVETQRGSEMGRVLWSGSASPDTRVPAPVLGAGEDRVLRAPRRGVFRARARIGDLVAAGRPVGEVEGEPVLARIDGTLRGLLADGVPVEAGVKVGDVDPRESGVDPARISDKGRAVAAGVLEAVLVGLRGRT